MWHTDMATDQAAARCRKTWPKLASEVLGAARRSLTGDALVDLVATALSSDAQALPQDAQARQALVEIAAALAAKNIATALALQERIKQLR
jgi:hypothetical protein